MAGATYTHQEMKDDKVYFCHFSLLSSLYGFTWSKLLTELIPFIVGCCPWDTLRSVASHLGTPEPIKASDILRQKIEEAKLKKRHRSSNILTLLEQACLMRQALLSYARSVCISDDVLKIN